MSSLSVRPFASEKVAHLFRLSASFSTSLLLLRLYSTSSVDVPEKVTKQKRRIIYGPEGMSVASQAKRNSAKEILLRVLVVPLVCCLLATLSRARIRRTSERRGDSTLFQDQSPAVVADACPPATYYTCLLGHREFHPFPQQQQLSDNNWDGKAQKC